MKSYHSAFVVCLMAFRGVGASSVDATAAAVNASNGECGLDGTQTCASQGSAATIVSDGFIEVANGTSATVTNSDSGIIAGVPFPKMPEKIRAILHEDWNVLDPKGEEMISTLSKIDGAVEFAHASTTFYEHLKETFGILVAWDQPEEVRRTGLVHTAYSGDLFQFFLFDANKEEERAELKK